MLLSKGLKSQRAPTLLPPCHIKPIDKTVSSPFHLSKRHYLPLPLTWNVPSLFPLQIGSAFAFVFFGLIVPDPSYTSHLQLLCNKSMQVGDPDASDIFPTVLGDSWWTQFSLKPTRTLQAFPAKMVALTTLCKRILHKIHMTAKTSNQNVTSVCEKIGWRQWSTSRAGWLLVIQLDNEG